MGFFDDLIKTTTHPVETLTHPGKYMHGSAGSMLGAQMLGMPTDPLGLFSSGHKSSHGSTPAVTMGGTLDPNSTNPLGDMGSMQPGTTLDSGTPVRRGQAYVGLQFNKNVRNP